MTPYKKRMNKYIKRMAEDMQLRNFADATIDAYTYHADKFCSHFGKTADQLGPEEIREYQLYLVNEKKVGWSTFNQAVAARQKWLDQLEMIPWNVYAQGPPHGESKPEHVVKYLARYMSGGPVADRRLISVEHDNVTFWARTRDKSNKSEPFTLRGTEFVRRWAMHILPRGYTRSRSYGGYHGGKKTNYLKLCRKLLNIEEDTNLHEELNPKELPDATLPTCRNCEAQMELIEMAPRPSWRDVFEVLVYKGPTYSPTLHLSLGLARVVGGHG